ncbi:hypothetical protein L7F22_046012 [Adiantum nelumboides]|nr:hypothetical protein [Adiantum nelumboides]
MPGGKQDFRWGELGNDDEGPDAVLAQRAVRKIPFELLIYHAREQDLQELFRPFGFITRIYVAFDRETGLSKRFAFINFVNKEDAIRAINKLDGYGYNILMVMVTITSFFGGVGYTKG